MLPRIFLICFGIFALIFPTLLYANSANVPLYEGGSFPLPPHQRDSWRAPATSLPKNFVSSTVSLFEQGLSDPRGCQYREVKLVIGDVWGHVKIIETHAWVLPKANKSKHDFAITWNGIVYPVISVGQEVDLETDVLKTISDDAKIRAQSKSTPAFPFNRALYPVSEPDGVSLHFLFPVRSSLLLRLGEVELAEKLYEAWANGLAPGVNNNDEILLDPYLELAIEWSWGMFDRAVCAHIRGDDRLALETARLLTIALPKIEAEAVRRKIRKPAVFDPHNGNIELLNQPHLGIFKELPALLTDSKRRVENGRAERASEQLEKYSDKSKAISALIQELEEVDERQWSQPGGVPIARSKIVEALINQGELAIPELLNVLEKDQRLTRSVSFGRTFHYGRHLTTVAEVAYVAIASILKATKFGPLTTHNYIDGYDDRSAVFAEVQAYWKHKKNHELLTNDLNDKDNK